MVAGCIVIVVVCAVRLIGYVVDWARSTHESERLTSVYYDTAASAPEPAEEYSIPQPDATTVPESRAAYSETTLTASPTREPWLSSYPDNPYRTINQKIKKLKRQNKDIIGWLHIDDMLDEAVVQRDNEYYLRRDYKGYHNINGALFLDEHCELVNQPSVYVIYGHNMKTGTMFGCLRNWENRNFYHNNPFIHFEAPYEEGEYVIFSIGLLKEEELAAGLALDQYRSREYAAKQRSAFVKTLERISVYSNNIDVTGEDQLLLLVTCAEKDHERRVVAARRVRADENITELKARVSRNRKK